MFCDSDRGGHRARTSGKPRARLAALELEEATAGYADAVLAVKAPSNIYTLKKAAKILGVPERS
jgi:hypothetical protein